MPIAAGPTTVLYGRGQRQEPQQTSGRSRFRHAQAQAQPAPVQEIDFSNLTLASLRKYKRVHKIRIKPTVSKAELVDVVAVHWAGLPAPAAGIEEETCIDDFLSAVRERRQQQVLAELQKQELVADEDDADEDIKPSSKPKRAKGKKKGKASRRAKVVKPIVQRDRPRRGSASSTSASSSSSEGAQSS